MGEQTRSLLAYVCAVLTMFQMNVDRSENGLTCTLHVQAKQVLKPDGVWRFPWFVGQVQMEQWHTLKGYSSQRKVHSINLHMYNILVVPSNCAQISLINNYLQFNSIKNMLSQIQSAAILRHRTSVVTQIVTSLRIVVKGKDWRNLR